MDLSKLQGTKIIELFKHLVSSKTIVSLQVMGNDFERLTCVSDIREVGKQYQLVIDKPNGFEEAVETFKLWQLRFNFNGPDRIEYIFNTQGGVCENHDLILPLPEYVERLQRRKNFRMPTPLGTQMRFQSKNIIGIVDLINISLGGAYGVIKNKGQALAERSLLKPRQAVYKICLTFPGLQSSTRDPSIRIQKAEVVRVDKDKTNHNHKYAFEFRLIDREEKQKLTEAIYRIQREYLQRR